MAIAKTYGFNSLSEAVVVRMEALHRPQKEAVGLVRSLIESPNLSEVQRALKKDGTFKASAVECVQEMVKEEMSAVVSNPKLSMASPRLVQMQWKDFLCWLLITNMPKVRSLLIASADSIGVPSHSSLWGVENPNGNNESDESEAEEGIKLENEMNRDKLIYQTDRASSQRRRDLVPTTALYMLSYAQSQRSNIYQMYREIIFCGSMCSEWIRSIDPVDCMSLSSGLTWSTSIYPQTPKGDWMDPEWSIRCGST